MTRPARVLVCGGRDFDARTRVYNALDALRPIGLIIHGGANGADRLADDWAAWRCIERKVFKADWKKYGPSAGPRRNAEMLRMLPDLVVAFPGGRGTADMVRRAKAAGVFVMER